MGGTPRTDPPPPRVKDPRIRRAAALWAELVLAATALLGVLVLWHLVRRGRLIRERLGPPRDVRLPEFEPRTSPHAGPPET